MFLNEDPLKLLGHLWAQYGYVYKTITHKVFIVLFYAYSMMRYGYHSYGRKEFTLIYCNRLCLGTAVNNSLLPMSGL